MAPKHMFSFVSQEAPDRLTVHVLKPDGSSARSRGATNSDFVAEQACKKAPPSGYCSFGIPSKAIPQVSPGLAPWKIEHRAKTREVPAD